MSKLKERLFAWLDRCATVKLDDTSSLQRWDRDLWKYIEGDHEMMIDFPLQSKGHPLYLLYRASLDVWLPPHDEETISEADKQRILDKVCGFLNARRYDYEVR